MRKPAGTWLIVLAVPVLVIAGLNVNMIMSGLDKSRLPMTFALLGGGVLLLSLGLGVHRKRNGLIALLVGAAVMAAIFFRQKSNGERWEAQFRRERSVKEAAEAVCAGTPNTAASGSVRGIVRATHAEESERWFASDTTYPQPLEGPEQVHVVSCMKRADTYEGGCDYEGGYHISFYKRIDDFTIYDAKTLRVLGTKRFEGAPPNTKCDESIRVSSRDSASHDAHGPSPDEAAEEAFIKSFLSTAERAP